MGAADQSGAVAVLQACAGGQAARAHVLGHPVVAFGIEAALRSRLVGRVVCHTDDPEVAITAERYGAEPCLAAERQSLAWFADTQAGSAPIIVAIRPEQPFHGAGQIDAAIELLLERPELDGLGSAYPLRARSVAGGPAGTTDQAGPFEVWRTLALRERRELAVGRMQLAEHPWGALSVTDAASAEMAGTAVRLFKAIRPAPRQAWSGIRLIVLDVDGTLTPGTLYYGRGGEALKRFHTHDGKGLELVRARGVRVAIITGEATAIAPARARKLGIEECHIGISDKVPVLEALCRRLAIPLAQVAYVGDDVGDLDAMRAVSRAGGIACAVGDARPEIRAQADFITPSPGGAGAVRDVCDMILAACAGQADPAPNQ